MSSRTIHLFVLVVNYVVGGRTVAGNALLFLSAYRNISSRIHLFITLNITMFQY